ncbi:hypothetical protein [Caulobacter sp.]|uniref:hypothetical protein n=1 Tax=Caulobacter sp. TaxID=78 RepID=UPI003BB120F5
MKPGAIVVQIHTLISLTLAVLICGLAMWRGDQPARWIGAAFLASWLGSQLINQRDSSNADYGLLAIDIATLVVFVWISMRTRRLWTVLVSAFAAIVVASHIAVMIDLRVTINTLKASMAIWSYGILACIAFGTWTAGRRRDHAPS